MYIKCNNLKKIISVWDNAIPDPKKGWICDCGRWTKLDKDNYNNLTHEILIKL